MLNHFCYYLPKIIFFSAVLLYWNSLVNPIVYASENTVVVVGESQKAGGDVMFNK